MSIEKRPEELRSPASLGKAYLNLTGLTPPSVKFAGVLSPEQLGWAAGAYFGGRAEIRWRHQVLPVMYLDFLSMYPTVDALLGLWPRLTARTMKVRDVTAAWQRRLPRLTAEDVFDPAFWQTLNGFALVRPHGDILPVRALYDDANDAFTIGLNPLTSDQPLWFALPDVVASTLLTGRAPEILSAWTLEPVGLQKGLRPIRFRGSVSVDPQKEDFFRRVIEERQRVKQDQSLSKAERDRRQKALKVLANATCYGVYAEMNRVEPEDGTEPVTVFGVGRSFPCDDPGPENPGEFSYLPFAAITTAAARLMLALLEVTVLEHGGDYVLCDTDSMAIIATPRGGPVALPARGKERATTVRALSRQQVTAIVERFRDLSPYDPKVVSTSILKVEDVNTLSGRPVQLWAVAISAKRYVLFNKDRRGEPVLRKVSEHGLGHLMDPLRRGAETVKETGPGDPEAERWLNGSATPGDGSSQWQRVIEPDHFRSRPCRPRYGSASAARPSWTACERSTSTARISARYGP